MKTKLYICSKCVACLGLSPVYSLVDSSVSVSSHDPRLFDYVGILVMSLIPLAHSILSAHPPSRLSELCFCLTVDICICFPLLLDEAFQQTTMLGSCLQAQQSIINNARGWMSFSHGMGLKLGLLVAHSLSLWFFFIPVQIVCRTNFGLKILWPDWCFPPTTESPSQLGSPPLIPCNLPCLRSLASP